MFDDCTPLTPVAAARIRGHDCFDRIWKAGLLSRRKAYKWLTRAMNLPTPAHFAEFSVEQCERAVELVNERFGAEL